MTDITNPPVWLADIARTDGTPVSDPAEARHAIALLMALPWDEAAPAPEDTNIGVWLVPAPPETTEAQLLAGGWDEANSEYAISISQI